MPRRPSAGRTGSGRKRIADPASAVLLAAEACFLRLGIAKTTMDDVAREAGVSRPTVYRYYATRDDLISGVHLARAQKLLDRAAEFVATQPTFADKMVEGMIFMVDAGRSDPLIMHLVSAEFMEVASRVSGTPQLAADLTAKMWEPVLREGQASGDVRADLDIERFRGLLMLLQLVLVGRIECLGADHPSHRSMLTRYLLPALQRGATLDQVAPAGH
jgi:AcrR family transcriptional regulator